MNLAPRVASRVASSLARRRRLPSSAREILLWTLVGASALAPTLAHAELGWDDARHLSWMRGICPDRGWGQGSRLPQESDLQAISALGGDALCLEVRAFVNSAESPFLDDPLLDDEFELSRMRRFVRRAHGLGLRVLLHPQIQMLSGEWRGRWRPRGDDAWPRWFAQYRRWIAGWAHFAQEAEVDLLGVGDALAATTSREGEWREVVAAVREAYDGPLYYAAEASDELGRLRWLDAVDLIGVVLDPDLDVVRPDGGPWSAAEEDSLRVGSLVQALAPLRATVFAACERADRPAFVGRASFPSVEEGWSRAGRDRGRSGGEGEADQRRAYRAIYESFAGQRWCRGVIWWGWRAPPTLEESASEDERHAARLDYARSASPVGKSAEEELRWQFSHPPFGWAAPLVRGRGGIVVSGDSLATAVGVEILRQGGNAADAAVATAFALAVTHPEAGNLGGGGFLLSHDARRRRTRALDFRETAPLAAHESLYLDLAELGDATASTVGPLAAGIPGSVAGLHALWERDGSMEWSALLEPAFRLASEGFFINARTARVLGEKRAVLERFPSTRAVFFREGRPLRRGERLAQPALAATLLGLRREGPGAFYRGSIARDLVRGVREAGGNWTVEDLANYRARWRRPGRVELDRRRRVEWLTMPPPSSGAVVLGQVAAFMDRQRADVFSPWSVERARAWVESFRLSFADRNEHLADPDHMDFGWRELVDAGYLRVRSRLLPRVGEIGHSDWVGPGWPDASDGSSLRRESPKPHQRRESPKPRQRREAPKPRQRREAQDTTHLVVLDARGNCVSLTTTLNALYGSGFLEPNTGIFLNDEMDDFDTRPGQPNLYGLVGNGRNVVRGGARMLSSMAPSIVLRDGRVWLALGGRGGPRILSGVAQVMYSRVFDDWPLDRAVSAPRVHHQWIPDEVRLEEGRQWPGLKSSLEAMGYSTRVLTTNGKIHAVEWTEDGDFLGVADPRDHGLARCVD